MLWQRILEWAKYLLKHKEQTEKNTADIKDQQQTLDELTAVIQHLAFELERQRENEGHEREKLTLRLENILLRKRSLPPGPQAHDNSVDALRMQLEALKQENEELRKQLDDQTK